MPRNNKKKKKKTFFCQCMFLSKINPVDNIFLYYHENIIKLKREFIYGRKSCNILSVYTNANDVSLIPFYNYYMLVISIYGD